MTTIPSGSTQFFAQISEGDVQLDPLFRSHPVPDRPQGRYQPAGYPRELIQNFPGLALLERAHDASGPVGAHVEQSERDDPHFEERSAGATDPVGGRFHRCSVERRVFPGSY